MTRKSIAEQIQEIMEEICLEYMEKEKKGISLAEMKALARELDKYDRLLNFC